MSVYFYEVVCDYPLPKGYEHMQGQQGMQGSSANLFPLMQCYRICANGRLLLEADSADGTGWRGREINMFLDDFDGHFWFGDEVDFVAVYDKGELQTIEHYISRWYSEGIEYGGQYPDTPHLPTQREYDEYSFMLNWGLNQQRDIRMQVLLAEQHTI